MTLCVGGPLDGQRRDDCPAGYRVQGDVWVHSPQSDEWKDRLFNEVLERRRGADPDEGLM